VQKVLTCSRTLVSWTSVILTGSTEEQKSNISKFPEASVPFRDQSEIKR